MNYRKSLGLLSIALSVAIPTMTLAQRAKNLEEDPQKSAEKAESSLPTFGFFQKGDKKVSPQDFQAKDSEIFELNMAEQKESDPSSTIVKISGKYYVLIGDIEQGLSISHRLIELPQGSVNEGNLNTYRDSAHAAIKEIQEGTDKIHVNIEAKMKTEVAALVKQAQAAGKKVELSEMEALKDQLTKEGEEASEKLITDLSTKVAVKVDANGNLVYGPENKILSTHFKTTTEDKSAEFKAVERPPLTEAQKTEIKNKAAMAQQFTLELMKTMSESDGLISIQIIKKGENGGLNTTNSFDFINGKSTVDGKTTDFFKK